MTWRNWPSSASCSANVTTSRLFDNAKQTHRPSIPFFSWETFFSCSEARPSCSKMLLSCSEVCSSRSETVFSCSDKAPFLYSRSLAFDSARSHSCWALWTFLSISFTASFNFAFSSMRGSILLISCYHCAAVHAMPCKSTKIMKNSNLQCQRRTSPTQR